MRTNLKNSIAIISILMVVYSCVEPIPEQKYEDRKVVVNCVLCNDSVQTLKLTYSTELGKFYYKEVDSAQARLYEDSLLVGEFFKTTFGEWQLNYTPKAQKHYELKIDIPNRSEISATTTMPNSVQILTTTSNEFHERRNLIQYSQDNPYWIFILSNPIIDSLPIYPVPANYHLLGSIGTNHPNVDRFNENTNMVNIWKNATTLEHFAYIRIKASPNNNTPTPFYVEGYVDDCVLFIRTPSIEYDKYMKSSIQKMMVYQAFDDPTKYFDENVVYNNIVNGIGVFGAYSDQHFMYYLDLPMP